MAASTKELQRRIRSITSTKKITKAMELVSAAKMRKAVEAVERSKAYAKATWQLAGNIATRFSYEHPLLTSRDVKRAIIVVISGNKGLCGGFNREVTERSFAFAEELKHRGVAVSFVTFGRKSALALASRGATILADFKKDDKVISASDLFPLKNKLTHEFTNGSYDAVYLSYTDFRSALRHVPRVVQLIPLSRGKDEHLGSTHDVSKEITEKDFEYTIEPSPFAALDYLLPRIVEIMLFQGVLESEASEQSARMVAMKNATEAADDMKSFLTLLYNRARQSSITKEIAEISAGRIALNV